MDSSISTKDLKSKLDKKQGITVVETLAPERYREAHLPGALNIPPEQIRELAPQLLPSKDAEIVTYCPRTRIDTPANTLPVNWRRWATRTWRTIPKANRAGWKRGFRWRRLHKKSLQPRSLRVSSPNQLEYSGVVYRKGALPLHFRHCLATDSPASVSAHEGRRPKADAPCPRASDTLAPHAVSVVRADHARCCGRIPPSSHAQPPARTGFRHVHSPRASALACPSSVLSFRATHIRARADQPRARA
jgi:hypothetical protein